MANGIKAPGTWIPGTKAGVVVESKYVKGGYITVDSIEERDRLLIETDVITHGTKVFVKNTNVEYIYVEHVAGEEGEFQSTAENTIQNVKDAGFVTNNQVAIIFEEKASDIVEKTVNEILPNEVDKKVDAKFETVSADIAKEATAAAKEAAVREVTQQIQEDFVSTERFNSELEPVKTDVAETKIRVEANEAAIEQNTSKLNELQSTAATKESLNNYYTKSQVDAKISGVYHYKGSVATYEDLPTENVEVGDVYDVTDTGMNYAWTLDGWDALGNIFEASNYYTKEEADIKYAAKAEFEKVKDALKKVTDDYLTSTDKEALKKEIETAQATAINTANSNTDEKLKEYTKTTGFKTINGQSIVGEGNILIEGGIGNITVINGGTADERFNN